MRSEPPSTLLTRRRFLRQAACAAVGVTALRSTLFDLRLINSAIAQSVPDDYKALVCLFLYGGNDANNLIVPRGSDYNGYAVARSNLALTESSLLPINPVTSDGRSYGLHPSCTRLQQLFESGKLAILTNVGTLVAPITRAEYLAGTKAKPQQLFSHNDQTVQWQTSISDQPSKTGWGGRCADLMNSVNIGSQISMSVSLAGANTFEVGNSVQQYQVSSSGAVTLSGVTGTRLQAMKDILALPHTNLFEKSYAETTSRAIDLGATLNSAIGNINLQTVFPSTSLGSQLKMIARLIGARSSLGLKRQIFFCSVGGYDLHGDQLTPHATLLGELSDCLKAFYDATVELNIADGVTAFTASDFGRTFSSNGQGSDHGWGSHQLVVGGAVKGQNLYGKMPVLTVNGPDDTGLGRWIPTTSVDQYAATLARWFGVTNSDLGTVFPNIGRFNNPNLGFMA